MTLYNGMSYGGYYQGLLYGYMDLIPYWSDNDKICTAYGWYIKDRHESIKCYCMTGIDLCMEYGIT